MERFRPKLATVLLIVNLAVVVLPLGSLFFFRIYENQLVRQTESELISQGAVLSAAYGREIRDRVKDLSGYGIKVTPPETIKLGNLDYVPILPQLDLTAQDPLPDRPDGLVIKGGPDEAALGAGAKLTDIIREAQRSTLAGLKILDYHGVVVAARFERGRSFAHVQEVATALKGKYASVIRERTIDEDLPAFVGLSRSTGIRIFVAYPIIVGDRLLGVTYLSRTPNSILQHLYAQRTKVFLASATIVAITLFLALLTSATISRPIKRQIKRARLVAKGDVEAMQPMARPGTQEMAQLSKSFSDMALSLHDRSEYISDFAAHVSHEFKTPLTSIQGAAELLEEHFDTMSGDERKRFVSNILSDTNRLRALVTRLLDLARADNITPDNDETEIESGLKSLAASFENVSVFPIKGRIAISPENFSTLFSNLIENGFQHGASEVTIAAKGKDGNVRFEVSDNGKGISQANRAKVFTPFFTTRRAAGGTGLGLGIVRSIAEAHGGSVALLERKKGAAFEITLPRL